MRKNFSKDGEPATAWQLKDALAPYKTVDSYQEQSTVQTEDAIIFETES